MLALGAAPRTAAGAIVREALTVAAAGIAIGLPIAAISARSLRSLLFGITESDPATFGIAALGLLAIGAAASLVPAKRAATVDPVIALRSE